METLLNKLWLYNNWANQLLMNSIQQQTGDIPYKTMHLLSHIMNAQVVWLERIKGLRNSVGIWDDHDLESCRKMHEQASLGIKEVLMLRSASLQQTIFYTNSNGVAYETQLDDILMQIFNHGTYHRGQIAQDLRINALDPIGTDYIAFVRSH
ncbi:MAG: DinB family protein [Pedobacter sp.]|uniref:DinB family protein n=1 Tax=Pedobacter sp. TaxID=1411316 RepID=UPI0033967F59